MSVAGAEPEEEVAEDAALRPTLARSERGLLLALGLNAWVICLLLPWLHIGFGEWGQIEPGLADPLLAGLLEALFCALPLGALAAGMVTVDKRVEVARLSLLVAFPVLLGAVLASREALIGREAYSPLGILLGGLSLLAFLALAARAVARPRELRPSVHKPRRYPEERSSRRAARLGIALLIGWAAGGVALIAVAPHLGGLRALEAAWGSEAAAEGGVVATVLAILLASGTVAGILGPGLRAQRSEEPKKVRLRRRLIALTISAFALGAWVFLRYLESQR